MTTTTTRRDLLKWSGLAMGVALLPNALRPSAVFAEGTAQRKRSIRLAHLTDMHIQPEKAAGEGVAACLQHVQGLDDRPELILTGGDTIMDSAGQNYDRTKLQWDLWKSVLKAECSLPVRSCLGNHDVWGWYKKGSKTTGSEPRWGKQWACDEFGIAKPYYSFDQAGWHFVLLDSIFPNEQTTYEGRLDDEQFAWLESDLAATPATTPVLVMSHIPILAACAIACRNADKDLEPFDLHGNTHTDQPKIRDLFLKHSNVKLCLSGHMHQQDRVDYRGVTYVCNGAVCGDWWKGEHIGTKPGYAVVDLFDDGTFANQYVEFGWKARA